MMQWKIAGETGTGMSWLSLRLAASLNNYLKEKRKRQAPKAGEKENE